MSYHPSYDPYSLRAGSSREYRRVLLAAIRTDYADGAPSPDGSDGGPHQRHTLHINGRRLGYDATMIAGRAHLNYVEALDQPQRRIVRLLSREERAEEAEWRRHWGWLNAEVAP